MMMNEMKREEKFTKKNKKRRKSYLCKMVKRQLRKVKKKDFLLLFVKFNKIKTKNEQVFFSCTQK